MGTIRKVATEDFLETHPVFSLAEANRALAPSGGRIATVERLKHHLKRGRLIHVTREIYAVVPRGVNRERFQPDPFLVARAVRPNGIFAYHAAFELLGVAHSAWNRYVVFTGRRRPDLVVGGGRLQFLAHPRMLRQPGPELGTRKVERSGVLLRVTGGERALVEGFRRPDRVGGLEELINCAAALPTLDLKVLERILECYRTQVLWAALGWFLERFQAQFHVPDNWLKRVEAKCPHSPRYLQRSQRGGSLVRRWNLILPETLLQGEPDETE